MERIEFKEFTLTKNLGKYIISLSSGRHMATFVDELDALDYLHNKMWDKTYREEGEEWRD